MNAATASSGEERDRRGRAYTGSERTAATVPGVFAAYAHVAEPGALPRRHSPLATLLA